MAFHTHVRVSPPVVQVPPSRQVSATQAWVGKDAADGAASAATAASPEPDAGATQAWVGEDAVDGAASASAAAAAAAAAAAVEPEALLAGVDDCAASAESDAGVAHGTSGGAARLEQAQVEQPSAATDAAEEPALGTVQAGIPTRNLAANDLARCTELPSETAEHEAPFETKLSNPFVAREGEKTRLGVKWNTEECYQRLTLTLGRPREELTDHARKNYVDKDVAKSKLKNRNGLFYFPPAVVKRAAKESASIAQQYGFKVWPLYIDVWRNNFNEEGRDVRITKDRGAAQFCMTLPFTLHLDEDDKLERVEMLDIDTIKAEQAAYARQLQQDEDEAASAAIEKLEQERAVPSCCALCHGKDSTEYGPLLAFSNDPGERLDGQTWYSHRHCAEWCQKIFRGDKSRRKHKKVIENEFVALKYLNDSKNIISPAEAIRDCWRIKCSVCGEKGAHLSCHKAGCNKHFHLKCANTEANVAVCRPSTEEWDEETDGPKLGHGSKDTFCADHSDGRKAEEFEPVPVQKDEPANSGAKTTQHADSSSSSSSDDDGDDDDDRAIADLVRARSASKPARSSPTNAPSAHGAGSVSASPLLERTQQWYKCVNQTVLREDCDKESAIVFFYNKKLRLKQKLRLKPGDFAVEKKKVVINVHTTRILCVKVSKRGEEMGGGWVSLVSQHGTT
jgi:hypothetical protein